MGVVVEGSTVMVVKPIKLLVWLVVGARVVVECAVLLPGVVVCSITVTMVGWLELLEPLVWLVVCIGIAVLL